MSIGKRTYSKRVVSAKGWEALRGAVVVVTDELLSDLRSDRPPELLATIEYLPKKYMLQYTPLFLKRFLVCMTVVGWKLFDTTRTFKLDCLAEELALNAILTYASDLLVEEGDEEDLDFLAFSDAAFEDADFEALFDPAEDGVEDTEIGAQLGMQNLKFSDWFLPFNEGFRVHPYVEDRT